MEFHWFPIGIAVAFSSLAFAQVEIPGNPMLMPEKSAVRKTGGDVNPGASIDPGKKTGMVRYVTHVILGQSRIWTNLQGKPLQAPLIAFEDLAVEAPKGTPPPKMPAPLMKPTHVKDGKIRLLVNQKPAEVVLSTLSAGDQEYVQIVGEQIDKKAAKAN